MSPTRIRLLAAAGVVGCLALGLGLQLVDRVPVVDWAGSILYVLLVGCLVLLVAPRASALAVAGVALGLAVAIELLQLTGIPAAIVDALPPARLVFGSSFDPWDLAAYAVGAAILLVVVRLLRRGAPTKNPHLPGIPGRMGIDSSGDEGI